MFSASSSSFGNSDGDGNLCSARGQEAVKLLPSYLADARAVEKYSAENPDGALQLGVAESQILEDWLAPALNERVHVDNDCIYYQPTAGRESFRSAMASYVEGLLDLEAGRLDTDGLVVGAGCNAVLENLCMCLAEPGDSAMICCPYYAAFEFDLGSRAGLFVQPVTTRDYAPNSATRPGLADDPSAYYPTAEALDAAHRTSLNAGHVPRILLISHPHNPLGICYPPEVMKECIDWCRRNRVHLISDEIYAGSVYRPESAGFQSVLRLADDGGSARSGAGGSTGLGPYVHWVYALSKDFALSGLRVGAAYTENELVRLPMQKLNDLCQISSLTQVWTENFLNKQQSEGPCDADKGIDVASNLWTTAFRRENHKRLRERCESLLSCLDECGIPYLYPTAGLFVWVDMSKFLPPASAAGSDGVRNADATSVESSSVDDQRRERVLYNRLMHNFGLLFTPGLSMRNEKPGYMRCVFTSATDEEYAIALDRIRSFAQNQEL